MALRRMLVPYSDFQPNTKILSQSLNTNFDEVEYCFNEFYEEYLAYKEIVYTKLQVDESIDNGKNTVKDEIIVIINETRDDIIVSLNELYNSMIETLDSEIIDVVNNGITVDYNFINYITDEQITEILNT